MNLNIRLIRIVGIILSLLILGYLLPIISKLSGLHIDTFVNDQDGLNDALSRSFIFSLLSSLLNVIISIIFSIGLWRIPLFSRRGRYLSLLLIPVLLGNVSVAFIGKLLFANSATFQDTSLNKFILLSIIQFWQFGTLYIYLFWLVIKSIPHNTWDYAKASKMSIKEQIKDIILPSCKNLAILLFILNFVFTIYEEAKIQFIFKASRGTGTELISQWLNRHYQSLSLLNVNLATESTIQISVIVLLLAVVLILLTSSLFNFFYQKGVARRSKILSYPNFDHSTLSFSVLLIFILLPIVFGIVHTVANLQIELLHLISPFAATFAAALISTIIGVVIGILWRLGWQNTMSSFNQLSIFLFIILLLLLLVPPIVLLLSGFQWLRIIGYQSNWLLYLLWGTGHVIMTLPLLSSFIIVTHFRTKNYELHYLQAYRLSLKEKIRDAFARRFWPDYLLALLVAFSLIWNEAIINNLLSDFIPSFVNEMKMAISGRSTDYARGISYLLVSLLISLFAILIWKSILDRSAKNDVDQI